MAWLGVPFKFLTDNSDSLTLAINSLPNVVLKSDPDYTSAVITGVVSLVAGIIPAGIAIFTFFRNSKIIKQERIEQQSFLKTEREEQQRFLKEERSAHTASMEADRENQREIAERDFNLQVLSVNRQAWINKLRDLISEYMAFAPNLLTVNVEYKNNKIYFQNISEKRMDLLATTIPSDFIEKVYAEASGKLEYSIRKIYDCSVKEKLLTGNIKLMLNPDEKWYGELVNIFDEVSIISSSIVDSNDASLPVKIKEMNHQMDLCLNCSQELLKYEWERVKKGI